MRKLSTILAIILAPLTVSLALLLVPTFISVGPSSEVEAAAPPSTVKLPPKAMSPENFSGTPVCGHCGCTPDGQPIPSLRDGSCPRTCVVRDCSGRPFTDSNGEVCRLDVNKDEYIDEKDTRVIKDHLNQPVKETRATQALKHLDTNNDGLISPMDVLTIINFINGNQQGRNTLDDCGICGGSGRDRCGNCPNDPNKKIDLGCGCGNPAPSGCDNKCGSTATDDACGVCGGDGSSCKETCTSPCGCSPDGTPIVQDECGICGGPGKNSCGSCDSTDIDLGCGCGKPGPSGCDNKCGSTAVVDPCGVCGGDGSSCKEVCTAPCGCRPDGSPILHDECGRCGGLGKNSCGSCDPNYADNGCGCGNPPDLGCGCGKPGPSGCDNKCGSTKTVNECGICGGTGNSCCEYYTISAAYPNENVYGHGARFMASIIYGTSYDLFSGEGAKLSCLDKIVNNAVASCYADMKWKNAGSSALFPQPASHYCEPKKVGGVYKTNAYWFGDDMFFHNIFDYEFYRLAGAINGGQYFKSDYDQMMFYAGNSDRDRDTAYHRATKKLNAKYMDKNCNIIYHDVKQNQICGNLQIDALISPISLQWNQDDASIDTKLVDFKINPHSSHSLFEWKASSKFPLLVYDKNKNGNVDDATELFGNWTMGGKQSSSMTSQDKDSGPWANGFEALAFFDSNLDGKIESNELDDISIWFDDNQDGKTDKGELFPIRSKGVTSLYYKGIDNAAPEKDLVLKQGFQRTVNGETLTGKSIDWYSKGYNNEAEAFHTRSTEATLRNLNNENTQAESPNTPLALTKKFKAGVLDSKDKTFGDLKDVKNPKTDFSGVWHWNSENNGLDVLNNGGLLGIIQDGSVVFGSSITETPLVLPPSRKDEEKELRSILLDTRIIGKIVKDKDGKECLRISTLLEDQRNESLVYLSEDGKMLIGETSGQISKGENESISASYKWTAKLIPLMK